MRILHVTDFHFCTRWFEWLASQAAEFDAVCLSGDMLDMFTSAEKSLHAQARWVRDWLRAWPAATPIFLCTGNHDWWPQSEHVIDNDAEGGWLKKARRPGVVFVDGDVAVMGGCCWQCWPWGSAPDDEGSPEPVVMLVHAPPQGTPISADCGRDVGDADVAAAAWRLPSGSLILSGHVHNPRRTWVRIGDTWCFNPGVADKNAPIPNHIHIDTKLKKAWLNGPGQAVHLLNL